MRRFDIAWLILWGLLSSAWCLTASRELSGVFDEKNNLNWGVTSWRTGSNYEFMRSGTMPLPVDLQYLPIHLWESRRGEEFAIPFDQQQAGDPDYVKKHIADWHTILPYARAMNLVFWWLLLVYGMLVAQQFGGDWAGRFAVVLLATEPNFLGHACLAMTDIAVTAMVLVFTFHYYRGRDRGRFWRWFIPGILYGLAMAAKASSLTFVPLIMLAFEIPRLWYGGAFSPPPGVGRVRHLWRSTSGIRSDGWKILFIGMIVVWCYCGSDWKPQSSFVKYADNRTDDAFGTPTLRWAAHHLTVFPNAGEAFAYQIKHNIRGHGSTILGEWYPRATWKYFPIALTIKLSLPVLALLAGLLLLRPRSLWTPIGLAALFLLVFTLNCRVQIGIRLVFPLIAVLLVTIAVGCGRVVVSWSDKGRFAVLGIVTAACAYPAIAIWPDGLRFGNELWGGPDNTYKYISDSNYDWGQGVYDLDRWSAQHELPLAHVWYFGMDPIVAQDPNRLLNLHDFYHYKIDVPDDTMKYVRGKVVAVSPTLLYGIRDVTPTMEPVIAFFRAQQPLGRTRTFFVFDFRDKASP
jgi:hypothetical protein